MRLDQKSQTPPSRVEGFLPAFSVTLIASFLYALLPAQITLGPLWVLPVIMLPLLLTVALLKRFGKRLGAHYLGHVSTAIMTCFIAYSLILLVADVFRGAGLGPNMLRASGILWVMNIIVFASWYWRLDAGGPMARADRGKHDVGCFLFPQMTLRWADAKPWIPHFIDYLFVAFNTSTAFSPTDTAILSRWAKLLVMAQSIISLGLVVLVVSRAVNII